MVWYHDVHQLFYRRGITGVCRAADQFQCADVVYLHVDAGKIRRVDQVVVLRIAAFLTQGQRVQILQRCGREREGVLSNGAGRDVFIFFPVRYGSCRHLHWRHRLVDAACSRIFGSHDAVGGPVGWGGHQSEQTAFLYGFGDGLVEVLAGSEDFMVTR